MIRITTSSAWPGIPLALAAAIAFGATTPLAKRLLGDVDPQMLAGLLYVGAGTGLAVFQLFRSLRRRPSPEASLTRADIPLLAAVIAAGGIAGPLLLMLGLARTPASASALLLNLESLATLAIAWLVFHEQVDRRLLIGAIAIVAGALALSWGGAAAAPPAGAALIAGACLAWGIDNNLTRKLAAADPVQIALLKGLAAGTVNTACALWRGAPIPPPALTAAAAVLGLIGIGVSLVLFIRAMRHLGAARTGAYFATAPFIGAIIAILLFDDPVTPGLAIAGALMALGLWLHLTENHAHEHLHEPLEHDHAHVHDAHHRHAHAHAGVVTEPHSHPHRHARLRHTHRQFPDMHHRHGH